MNAGHQPLEVLLVEDSQEDVFFFERALSKSGINARLRIASDGREAVRLLGSKETPLRPDLIFLDLKMPLLSGFDVLRWVREQHFSPPLRIIVLSGSPHEKDQRLSAELGAAEYLVKPITPEMLRIRLIGQFG
jgi:DNA-binding response OmpR family regulator